jgi:hypothetical protein
LIFVIGRSTRHAGEVIEVMLLSSLPITSEEQPAKALPPSPSETNETSEQRRGAVAPAFAAGQRVGDDSAVLPDARSSTDPAPHDAPTSDEAQAELAREHVRAPTSDTPKGPIDWYAEARSTADALEQRDRADRERRPLDRPNGSALVGPSRKPPCPFEKCEPGWGNAPSVFDSTATKAGRIEKTFDGEVIRWISNRCYQILVTPEILHRAMTRCVTPLKKSKPRGDLFKHMKEAPPPPADRATDVP